MITNERQYRITKAAARDFKQALARLETAEESRPAALRQVMREALVSQLEELREQLREYEAVRDGRIAVLELDSLAALPEALIRARIAAGLTQKELAAALGVKEQQVQQYEATRYARASFARVQRVAEVLGVRIAERVELPARPRTGTPDDPATHAAG